jgi:hypothetical protein
MCALRTEHIPKNLRSSAPPCSFLSSSSIGGTCVAVTVRMAIGAPMHHVRNAARGAKPWVTFLARAGFASRAVLSCTIGVLAALAAFGDRDGKTTDSKGALRELHDKPFGQVLLALVAVGVFGYAIWLFVQACLDPERPARA